MEKVQWKVEGMHCANCALTVHKYLQKHGADNVAVNAIDGDVSFDIVNGKASQESLVKGVESLGYKVPILADSYSACPLQPYYYYIWYRACICTF